MSWFDSTFKYLMPEQVSSYFWNYSLFACSLTVGVFLLDRVVFGPLGDGLEAKKSLRIDILNVCLELFNLRRGLGAMVTLGFIVWVESQSYKVSLQLLDNFDSYPLLKGIIFILTYDFFYYWYHRVRHHRALWPIHGYHHSTTFLNPLSNLRFHALNHPMFILFFGLPYYAIFGPEPLDLFLFIVITYIPSSVAHSRWDSDFGWLGRYIIVSPQFHRLHHRLEPEFAGCNYGGIIFVFWDRMFNTYRDPTQAFCGKTGIPNNYIQEESFVRSYLQTFFELIKSIKQYANEKLLKRN